MEDPFWCIIRVTNKLPHMSKQTAFIDLIDHHFGGLRQEIKNSLKFNDGVSFDTGKFGERVNFVLHDTTGVPSNGGCAFDAANGAEAKACNKAQTYVCPDCGSKNNYYAHECHKCGSTGRKDPNDTRWGIDTEAHFKYVDQMPYYCFTIITPLNRSVENPKFNIQVYRIDTKNKFFNDMLCYQLEHGKKAHKNFMPLGRDFYMSSPKMLVDCNVSLSDEVDVEFTEFNTDGREIETIPLSLFTKSEQEQLQSVDGSCIITEAVNVIGVKKSTHGKERGTLNRNNRR